MDEKYIRSVIIHRMNEAARGSMDAILLSFDGRPIADGKVNHLSNRGLYKIADLCVSPREIDRVETVAGIEVITVSKSYGAKGRK